MSQFFLYTVLFLLVYIDPHCHHCMEDSARSDSENVCMSITTVTVLGVCLHEENLNLVHVAIQMVEIHELLFSTKYKPSLCLLSQTLQLESYITYFHWGVILSRQFSSTILTGTQIHNYGILYLMISSIGRAMFLN